MLRLLEMTFLPPFVDMRTKNPWVVARFFFLGWYVIDMGLFYRKKEL